MAKGEIRNKIVLEGEAEYKKSLADINRSIRESKSALKAVSEEYKGADESMEGMYKQGDALERVISDQESALRLMTEQLEKVEGAYGKNSREAAELRTRINNMRIEIAKSQNELKKLVSGLDDTGEGLEDAALKGEKAGDSLAEIGDEAKKSVQNVQSLSGAIKDLTGLDLPSLAGGAGLIGAAAKGIDIGNQTKKAFNQVEAFTGLTGEALEQLKEDAREVYKQGVGDNLSEAAQYTAEIAQQLHLTGEPLQETTRSAAALADVFGMDVSESARSASMLMHVFGIDSKKAYDLMATGAQQGANKNGNLLDTINEYAPYFEKSGKSADEFFAALITGAQGGVYDVDKVGDAWKEFTLRMTEGSDETKDALADLGFEAGDITRKFAQGGSAADKASEEIVAALMQVEDPMERNRLGVALFGTQWEDTGGKVLPVFASMETGLEETQGAAQKLADVHYDDLDTAWRGLKGRLEELAEPALVAGVNLVSGALDELSRTIDAIASGDVQEAIGQMIEPSDLAKRANAAGTMAGEAWGQGYAQAISDALSDPDTVVTADGQPPEVDDLFAAHDKAAGEGNTELAAQIQEQIDDAVDKAVEGVKAGEKTLSIDDLFAARSQAAGEGDMALVAQLDAQIEQVIAGMAETAHEGGDSVGGAAVEGFAGRSQEMAEAGEQAGKDTADGLVSMAPEAEKAGIELGEAGTDGAREGTGGMQEAGSDGAAGLVSGLRSGIGEAFSAGYATGKAYERGYRSATKTHSPSRVMMAAAKDTAQGLVVGSRQEEREIRRAAAALGDAMLEGYTERTRIGGMRRQETLTGGLSAQMIAQAVREGIQDMRVDIDGIAVGYVTAPGVSRSIRSASIGTVKGQSAKLKSF